MRAIPIPGAELYYDSNFLEIEEPSSSTNYRLVSIALVTVSNGADNVGVYVPFFLVSRAYLWVILIAYAVLIALWCFAGRWLSNHSVFLHFD